MLHTGRHALPASHGLARVLGRNEGMPRSSRSIRRRSTKRCARRCASNAIRTFTETLAKVTLKAEDKVAALGADRAKVAVAELTDEEKAKLDELEKSKAVAAFREKLGRSPQGPAEDHQDRGRRAGLRRRRSCLPLGRGRQGGDVCQQGGRSVCLEAGARCAAGTLVDRRDRLLRMPCTRVADV